MGPTGSDDMAALAAAIGGTVPPPALPTEQQLMKAAMEVAEQSNDKATEETEAQQSGSTEPAKEDASNTYPSDIQFSTLLLSCTLRRSLLTHLYYCWGTQLSQLILHLCRCQHRVALRAGV